MKQRKILDLSDTVYIVYKDNVLTLEMDGAGSLELNAQELYNWIGKEVLGVGDAPTSLPGVLPTIGIVKDDLASRTFKKSNGDAKEVLRSMGMQVETMDLSKAKEAFAPQNLNQPEKS